MNLFNILCISSLSISFAAAKIGLVAQPFQLAVGSNLTSVKLSWSADSGATDFTVWRKTSFQPYTILSRVESHTYDDYEIPSTQVTYLITVSWGPSEVSNEAIINGGPMSTRNYSSYDNAHISTLRTKSKVKLGNTYYKYHIHSDAKGLKEIVETTSPNGYDFLGDRVILTREQVCSGADGRLCKLEATTFVQHPKTLEVVMWAHWEKKDGYGAGKVAAAYGYPGASNWTFAGAFKPAGHDSRDLSFFGDDDDSGYLLSTTRANRDVNLYALTPDWRRVSHLVTTLLKDQHREAPSMVRYDNMYYLFTSLTASWYPSAGQYISAPTITGPWSNSRNIGNTACSGAQSGSVDKIGATWVMRANRWSAQWIEPAGPNRQVIMPISFQNGFASYHFYEKIIYLDDATIGGVYGVQNGKIVSVGKKVKSSGSITGHEESQANDGIQTHPENYHQPSSVPFTYDVDLGANHRISQIDLITRLVGGSETFYKYELQGRTTTNGPWITLANHLNNTDVGFVMSKVNDWKRYQYIRLDVKRVVNVYNKRNANGFAGVIEMTVYSG